MWARSRQILTTVFSKTDGRNICSVSLDRTRINHNWLPAMVAPPPIIAETQHGSDTLCYGPKSVRQLKMGDACPISYRGPQLCTPTPIPCGCFFSWVQNLIPASLKFGWESNFTYAAIFSEKYRTKGPANQNLVENQISQILHMLPFFARHLEKMTQI